MTGRARGPVAVNLMWCVPGVVGGSEEYLVRQLRGLSAIAPPLAVTAYGPRGFRRAHPELATMVGEAPMDGTNRVARVVAESTWLRWATRGAALVHHGGGTVPALTRRPCVLTIHDLQYLSFPQYLSRTKLTYLRAVVPRSVRRADVVTVPTEFVRSTVCEAFGVHAAGVVVVPHGLEPSIGASSTPEAVLRTRYHLGDGPVVVYPAITHPHKNHAFLVRMLQQAPPGTLWRDPALRVMMTGGAGAGEAGLVAEISHSGQTGRIRRPGRVSDEDRDGLLAMAAALVFPSEYEGFGAPVVEAMALGCPVVASDAACLPEVVGGAGLVRTLDVGTWAGALDEAVGRRAELVAAGHRRAVDFTSARSGEALLRAYRQAQVRA